MSLFKSIQYNVQNERKENLEYKVVGLGMHDNTEISKNVQLLYDSERKLTPEMDKREN